jgi:hypothetical protein
MLSRFEIQMLLDELCVAEGFCLPPGAAQRLASDQPDDIVDFTDAVFRAEGLDPRSADRRLYRRVRSLVADAFRMAR